MEVLASYQRGQNDNRARYAADRTLLPSKLIGSEMKSTNEMNEMNSTIEMNPNSSSYPLNSSNSLNSLNQSNALNGDLLHPSIPIERFPFLFSSHSQLES